MTLIFRLMWMWITAHAVMLFGTRPDIMSEDGMRFRCLPTDLDFNFHMTNTRYNSFMDLARIGFLIRAGAWTRLRRARLYPVLGSSTIKFRRSIQLFEAFEVTTRVAGWDDKWIFMEHKLITSKDVAAVAIMKTAFLDKQGRVPIEMLVGLLEYAGSKPDLSPAAQLQLGLDAELRA